MPISEARKRTLALQRALEFSTGVNVNCPRRFTNIPSETVPRLCLEKLRLGRLDNFDAVLPLENEAGELCAIFAAIALKVADRMDREKRAKQLKN